MIALVSAPIDVRAIEALVIRPGAGAVLTFLGTARDHFEGRPVLALEYEAYPELALPELAAIAAELRQRWPEARLALAHRTGRVPIGEPTVSISVSAPHRDACYQASRFAIDALKARVPIWKKEIYADGAAWKANAPAEGLDV